MDPNTTLDEVHGEHLSSSKYKIITCIGEQNDARTEDKSTPNTDYIDYFESLEASTEGVIDYSVMENYHGFVISKGNSRNKFSDGYENCTGIVIIGTEKSTGENISLMTHQDPNYFLSRKPSLQQIGYSRKGYFGDIMQDLLTDFRNRCEEGTIDAIILGGNSRKRGLISKREFGEYKDSIGYLNRIIYDVFGFEGVVAGGPSKSDEDGKTIKNIFVDTIKRRVHLMKAYKDTDANIIFVASKVNKVLI